MSAAGVGSLTTDGAMKGREGKANSKCLAGTGSADSTALRSVRDDGFKWRRAGSTGSPFTDGSCRGEAAGGEPTAEVDGLAVVGGLSGSRAANSVAMFGKGGFTRALRIPPIEGKKAGTAGRIPGGGV